MLKEVDKQKIRDHAEGKRDHGATVNKIKQNVRTYAKQLGATDPEINDILHELRLS